jgi:hypothetical protein
VVTEHDPASLVVEPGDLVRLSGLIIGDDADTWTIQPRQTPGERDRSPAAAVRSENHVPLTGMRSTPTAPRQSWEEVVGRWNGSEVDVIRTTVLDRLHDFWTPAPVSRFDWRGPWAVGPAQSAPTSDVEEELIQRGVIVSRKVVSVGGGRSVVAIAATSPEEVESAIGDRHAGRLKVWRSPWTSEEFWRANDALVERFDMWGLHVVGDHVGPSGQSIVVASLRHLTAEIAAWHAAQPAGLVDLRPWIRPAVVAAD